MRRSLRHAQRVNPGVSDIGASAEQVQNIAAGQTRQARSNVRKRTAPPAPEDASRSDDEEYRVSEQETALKKRKISKGNRKPRKNNHAHVFEELFRADNKSPTQTTPCRIPRHAHNVHYHRPLMLDSRQTRTRLLKWFDGVSTSRSMPWRKQWIDPRDTPSAAELREQLERRAYEVWISEIMLQQTRVAVVIDYWNRWMGKWPTIHELAAAQPDEVLAAWRGLGYYSRATRIHEAAKQVCGDSKLSGLLPSAVDELVAKVSGVGRYTAGAISAIVFGKAAPMVDGNVLRVLSRQLGIYGDVKTDKAVIDLLWAAADGLVNAVALDSEDGETLETKDELVSDRPGRWGQALMELGSTVCTPKPECAECPITETCRAYNEGLQLATDKGLAPERLISHADSESNPVTDIEDACNFCRPFEALEDASDHIMAEPIERSRTVNGSIRSKSGLSRQSTLSHFFQKHGGSTRSSPAEITHAGLSTIVEHARRFPVKVVKKAVKEQETLVCAVRRNDGRYLITRRPPKGLLAGLWEFPSWIVPGAYIVGTEHSDRVKAMSHVMTVMSSAFQSRDSTEKKPCWPVKFVARLGSVPWLFSHLKLNMHVFLFEIEASDEIIATSPDDGNLRWSEDIEGESMGTGMRKCWELVRDANGG